MSDVESDYEEEETNVHKESTKKVDDADNPDDNAANNADNDDDDGSEDSESNANSDEEEDEDAEDEDEDELMERIFGEDTPASTKKTAVGKKPKVWEAAFGPVDIPDDEEFDDEGDGEYNEDAYDEEEYGFKYLQKFDKDTRKQIIDEYHREALQHSYDEIEAMCCIVRTEDGVIDALHRTPPFLTKYEKARILGERAKQLGAGAAPFIELEPDMIDEYTIAVMEMKQGKLPFIIKRPLPNGGCEYWRLADLEIL